MKFAIDIPNFGPYADPRVAADTAREAEEAGWDAVWLWDHVWRDEGVPYGDPWILLASMALATTRVRLGPMVTPLPRRRPWTVAREAVTLDHLSGGRFTLGVGLGNPAKEFTGFGEDFDPKLRAAKLDEGLAIIERCWSGERFSFAGEHYTLEDVQFLPAPLQPRIPIWTASTWPVKAPFRRAARLDGTWPLRRNGDGTAAMLTPDDVREIRAFVAEVRAASAAEPAAASAPAASASTSAPAPEPRPFDILVAGVTPGDDPARAAGITAEFAEAGATWWTERINNASGSYEWQRERIRQGPPRA